MYTLCFLALLSVLAFAGIVTQKRYLWNKAQKMYCYFEYEYHGEKGSSRDYGAMLEIDAVGAMNYRRDLGAVITFEEYNTDEEKILELIDKRYYFEQQQLKRKR